MAKTLTRQASRIVCTAGVRSCKPRIAGRRIAVQDIAIRYELMGHSADAIAEDYRLSLGDVHAALAYYYDHKEELDEDLRRQDGLVRTLRKTFKSKLSRKLHARED